MTTVHHRPGYGGHTCTHTRCGYAPVGMGMGGLPVGAALDTMKAKTTTTKQQPRYHSNCIIVIVIVVIRDEGRGQGRAMRVKGSDDDDNVMTMLSQLSCCHHCRRRCARVCTVW